MIDAESFRRNANHSLTLFAAALVFLQLPGLANADAMSTTMETLLDRVRIEDMMVEYYTILPLDDHGDLGSFFSENAVLELNGEVFEGRDAIQSFYDSARDPRIVPGKHYNMMFTNPRITVDGNTATMNSLWTGVLSDSIKAPPRLIEQGTEYCEFVKQNGRWLITRRVIVSQSGLP